jgi:peptidoglycan/xylan/chitin deacetylase (PgdA/CDA1 family)
MLSGNFTGLPYKLSTNERCKQSTRETKTVTSRTMKPRTFLSPALVALLLSYVVIGDSCQASASVNEPLPSNTSSTPVVKKATAPATRAITKASAATILARPQVPILCYHHIRDWRATDSKTARDYIVPVDVFRSQMKALADSGYHTILPDQLYSYLNEGTPLPDKPVMLTFDDTDLEQFTVAKPEMDKHGFKAVYFIMTVSLGRPNYMNSAQVKTLSDEGNVIGSHTWDHHNVKQYVGDDWKLQVDKPTVQLEKITGKPIRYFAYPFGLWSHESIEPLKQRNFLAAFQLSAKYDQSEPLYSIRRIIVPGSWSPNTMLSVMHRSFKSSP